MKRADSLLPEHEGLRRPGAWLLSRTIEEAARRFDLSPLDEDFLLNYFRDAARGETSGRTYFRGR